MDQNGVLKIMVMKAILVIMDVITESGYVVMAPVSPMDGCNAVTIHVRKIQTSVRPVEVISRRLEVENLLNHLLTRHVIVNHRIIMYAAQIHVCVIKMKNNALKLKNLNLELSSI
jgi:hypothetical protein